MVRFDEVLDPVADVKDYIHHWENWLDPQSDTIDTFSIDPPAEATALGLEIQGVPVKDATSKYITAWYKVNSSYENDDAYEFPGKCFLIDCTITTAGGRTKREQFELTVSRPVSCE